jgi:hypothetical protein
MNKCVSSSNNFTISNVNFDISNTKFTISNVNLDISNVNLDISNVNFDISNVNFDISYDASYSIIYKTNKPKPKKTLLQKIIKLNTFLCYQAATLLILTIILSSFCKCYDVLIYASFGTFISMMFFGAFGLLLKFKVIASQEFNEKYNYTQCYYLKKYVQLPKSFLFTYMAVSCIGIHMFYGFLALYYVKTFIKNSISTKYSYIIGYLLILLFFAINYNSGFKLYNNSLKCTVDEYNKGVFLTLLVVGGLIYYFETIKVSI